MEILIAIVGVIVTVATVAGAIRATRRNTEGSARADRRTNPVDDDGGGA